MPDPLVGKTVLHYEIAAKLGGGGMGVVYKARDTKLGRVVALKFLPPQWSHDEGAKQRFIREAQAASSTDHPNICTIHSIESADDGQLFIVMAYYEGRTLKQKLEEGALASDQALLIATQVAEGLAKAHEQGVVHRDIKPGNLMLTENGVKILDFGLAKFADSLHLTIVGTTIGTVAYMSPEQARGEEADARSDIWALGVVLYEMLTGELPFKGPYPEAVSYAIRNDPPPPLRIPGRDISEELERLVLRAIHKDPAERFQSARELARELRLHQGWTIPQDLFTEPLPPRPRLSPPPRGVWQRLRAGLTPTRVAAFTAALLALAAGTAWWLSRPVTRLPVAVAPVTNLTGYAELDAYRLALTESLVRELGDSPNIRVLPYARLLEIAGGLLLKGTDPTSREVLQAITTQSGAQVVIVPTLVRENGNWRARAEFRSAERATNVAVFETNPVVSSLIKDTAYSLTASLADGIEEPFKATAPLKLRLVDAVRGLLGYERRPATARLRTLDAAAAFEQGLREYGELEYVAAGRSFARAAEQDASSPLSVAWLSRVALRSGRVEEARAAADRALGLVTPETPAADRLFVTAVSAESRRDFTIAEASYRDLVARYPDEPVWLAELAGFEERQGRHADAADLHHRALKLGPSLVGPHLALCRLYSPTNLNEFVNAREQGQLALKGYAALGARGGQGQALMCLTDVLRMGKSDEEVREGRRNAETAVKIFEDLRYEYNLARAYNYVALAAGSQGVYTEAAALWEKSLTSAKASGNSALEPLVLMNLSMAYETLGSRSRAVDYRQQSLQLYEAAGNQTGAAQNRANRGAILIEYGNPEEGLRDIETALAVFQKLGDKNFEVFCLQLRAAYYRYAGRHGDAEGELNNAMAIATQRDLKDKIADSTVALARSRFDVNDYGGARGLLLKALGDDPAQGSLRARVHFGRVQLRMGDITGARTYLNQALVDAEKRDIRWILPLLHTALGELAYQSGAVSEARASFGKAAALWTAGELPDAASVEARAYLGLLDALAGRPARGEAAVRSSLNQARAMGRFALEMQCRLYLARIAWLQRKADEALRLLNEIPADGDRVLGPEIQAQAHYWRGQALKLRGDRAAGASEEQVARQLVESVRASLPEQSRPGFASRPDIRLALYASGS